MYVESLKIINFRNFLEEDIKFSRDINIFIGNNAQGKTNLLEAIYLSASGNSFRTKKDREMINFNKSQSYLGSYIFVNEFTKHIEIKLDKAAIKRIKVNEKEIKNIKEFYSGMNLIVFSPDDLYLVKGAPSNRREFLDEILSGLKPEYNFNIKRYYKILNQRNNILKNNKKENLDIMLDVFDQQLVEIGSKIYRDRAKFLRPLEEVSAAVESEITGYEESLKLKYISQVDMDSDINKLSDNYNNALKEGRKRDKEYYSTEIGPHRDDFTIYINNRDMRIYGSQGQQRTVVLALKLAALKLMKRETGLNPILFLDDVFSELDNDRGSFLCKSIKDLQVFITATDLTTLTELKGRVFNIAEGKIEKISE